MFADALRNFLYSDIVIFVFILKSKFINFWVSFPYSISCKIVYLIEPVISSLVGPGIETSFTPVIVGKPQDNELMTVSIPVIVGKPQENEFMMSSTPFKVGKTLGQWIHDGFYTF